MQADAGPSARAGPTTVTAVLEAVAPGGVLRVAVRDDNPGQPGVGHHPDLTAEIGRGLLLVSTLADD